MVTIKPGTPIQRIESIPDSERTEKRDTTADVIEDLWPEEKTTIADEADCSRTHVDNVLSAYFEPVDPSASNNGASVSGDLSIEIPQEAVNNPLAMKMYLKGVLEGFDMASDEDAEVSADVGDLFSDGGTVVS